MIYTRSESTGTNQFFTFKEAFAYAQKDPTIWKISFTQLDERTEKPEHIRLVRDSFDKGWRYESADPMLPAFTDWETLKNLVNHWERSTRPEPNTFCNWEYAFKAYLPALLDQNVECTVGDVYSGLHDARVLWVKNDLKNKKIPVIKHVRVITGCGLKEAKDMVEWMMENYPS